MTKSHGFIAVSYYAEDPDNQKVGWATRQARNQGIEAREGTEQQCMEWLKTGKASALVTGASLQSLPRALFKATKRLPQVRKIAATSIIPTRYGRAVGMDLGAVINYSAEDLLVLARLGSAYARIMLEVPHPSVALVSNGTEEEKGTPDMKAAADLLRNARDIHYIGYTEGNFMALPADIPGDPIDQDGLPDRRTTPDVVLYDNGFTGNIALKTGEGMSSLFQQEIRQAFGRNLYTKLVGALARPILKQGLSRFSYQATNGGIILGLDKIVVKSHGGASQEALLTAIHMAYRHVGQGLVSHLRHALKNI